MSAEPPILPAMQRGILGGTFDPPHLAHLFAGEAAYRDLGLDVVTFMPAGVPWQKAGRKVSKPEHRWQMTRLALHGIDYFEPDDREIRRDGFTYTVDSLETFPASEKLTFILGADAARGISTWQRAPEVLRRARIAVVPRPGVRREDVDWALRGADYVWLETPEVWLSGTMLRERASQGRSLRFLVSDPVWQYISEHQLYADERPAAS
jgi:nicotinate-nucleotide adenylyltransferase